MKFLEDINWTFVATAFVVMVLAVLAANRLQKMIDSNNGAKTFSITTK